MARTGRPRIFEEADVVEAAASVFWEHGYGSTTMQRLAESGGLLPGSLHAAFGGKHPLFLRALAHYAGRQRAFVESLQETGPVLPRLRSALHDIADSAGSDRPRGCMLGNTVTELGQDPAAVAIVREAFGELERGIARALARAQDEGEVAGTVEPRHHARMLVALMQGLHVMARVVPDAGPLRAAADAALAPLGARG